MLLTLLFDCYYFKLQYYFSLSLIFIVICIPNDRTPRNAFNRPSIFKYLPSISTLIYCTTHTFPHIIIKCNVSYALMELFGSCYSHDTGFAGSHIFAFDYNYMLTVADSFQIYGIKINICSPRLMRHVFYTRPWINTDTKTSALIHEYIDGQYSSAFFFTFQGKKYVTEYFNILSFLRRTT